MVWYYVVYTMPQPARTDVCRPVYALVQMHGCVDMSIDLQTNMCPDVRIDMHVHVCYPGLPRPTAERHGSVQILWVVRKLWQPFFFQM